MPHPWVLYIVWCRTPDSNGVRSYIGITNDLRHRLKQHRGQLAGGAKYTTRYTKKGCHWELGATAHSFRDETEVRKVEWALQNPRESRHLKQRTVRFSNALWRNVSNLFYLTRPESKFAHIGATLHCAPPATTQHLQEEAFQHFRILPDRLLLAGRYAEHLALHRQDATKITSTAPTPDCVIVAVKRRTVNPAAKSGRCKTKQNSAELYRAKAQALLQQARECILIN